MKPVSLDSGNYGGTYKLIGEEISFDFINEYQLAISSLSYKHATKYESMKKHDIDPSITIILVGTF